MAKGGRPTTSYGNRPVTLSSTQQPRIVTFFASDDSKKKNATVIDRKKKKNEAVAIIGKKSKTTTTQYIVDINDDDDRDGAFLDNRSGNLLRETTAALAASPKIPKKNIIHRSSQLQLLSTLPHLPMDSLQQLGGMSPTTNTNRNQRGGIATTTSNNNNSRSKNSGDNRSNSFKISSSDDLPRHQSNDWAPHQQQQQQSQSRDSRSRSAPRNGRSMNSNSRRNSSGNCSQPLEIAKQRQDQKSLTPTPNSNSNRLSRSTTKTKDDTSDDDAGVIEIFDDDDTDGDDTVHRQTMTPLNIVATTSTVRQKSPIALIMSQGGEDSSTKQQQRSPHHHTTSTNSNMNGTDHNPKNTNTSNSNHSNETNITVPKNSSSNSTNTSIATASISFPSSPFQQPNDYRTNTTTTKMKKRNSTILEIGRCTTSPVRQTHTATTKTSTTMMANINKTKRLKNNQRGSGSNRNSSTTEFVDLCDGEDSHTDDSGEHNNTRQNNMDDDTDNATNNDSSNNNNKHFSLYDYQSSNTPPSRNNNVKPTSDGIPSSSSLQASEVLLSPTTSIASSDDKSFVSALCRQIDNDGNGEGKNGTMPTTGETNGDYDHHRNSTQLSFSSSLPTVDDDHHDDKKVETTMIQNKEASSPSSMLPVVVVVDPNDHRHPAHNNVATSKVSVSKSVELYHKQQQQQQQGDTTTDDCSSIPNNVRLHDNRDNSTDNNNGYVVHDVDDEKEDDRKPLGHILHDLKQKHGNNSDTNHSPSNDKHDHPNNATAGDNHRRPLHPVISKKRLRPMPTENEIVLNDKEDKGVQTLVDTDHCNSFNKSKVAKKMYEDDVVMESMDVESNRKRDMEENGTTGLFNNDRRQSTKRQTSLLPSTTNNKQITKHVAVDSGADYMSIVDGIENDKDALFYSIPPNKTSSLTAQRSIRGNTTLPSETSNVVVAPASPLLTLTINKKVPSPNNRDIKNKTSNSMLSRMFGHFTRPKHTNTKHCQAPKPKSGRPNIIKPGAAICTYETPTAAVFQDDDIFEFDDSDSNNNISRRNTRSHSRGTNDRYGQTDTALVRSQQGDKSQKTVGDTYRDESILFEEISSTKSYRLRETKSRKQRRSNDSVIEIASSSDDESLYEPMKNSVAAKKIFTSVEFTTFRIAIGKQVYFNDCCILFSLPSTTNVDSTLRIEYKKETRRLQNHTRTTRHPATRDSVDTAVHCINMTQDLLEFKFYISEHDTVAEANMDSNVDDITDTESELLTNNLLAMRIKTTESNGLDKISNSYKPELNDPAKQWIVIELCTDDDMVALRTLMQEDRNLSAFVTDESRLSRSDAKACCQSLLKDNGVREQQAHCARNRSNTTGQFLEGKSQQEVLLVYPFGTDSKAIDHASTGLTELSCVLEYENSNTVHSHITTENEINAPEPEASAVNEVAESSNKVSLSTEDTSGEASRAVLILSVSTIERLEPGVYLNDTLIDFWQKWIWRNAGRSYIHYFTTHFYTTLEENNPESVKRWTEKRSIDVFSKRFIFIPINKSLHWSMCVVVNPGAIIEHRSRISDDDKKGDMSYAGEPFPCILFFDSLRAHAKGRVATLVRTWLNSEWKRLRPEQPEQAPFDSRYMKLFTPKIPYQDNSWDCGVYVCRYMYAMYLLRSHRFTYAEVGYFGPSNNELFHNLIASNVAFRFGSKDIVRIRYEFMDLIERLSKLFQSWKTEDVRRRAEARRLKKTETTSLCREIV